MIVPVTSDKYRNLFIDAELFLNLDKGTINDLNAYYGYMKKFYDKALKDPKGYKFIMMPLDEEVFKIDLNSRSINVPASFTRATNGKVSGVQADQMAELIIFEADRYFDYMDLANTDIYVQWQLPNETHTTGATFISMRDLSEPGKIRFAWPLYDVITKYNGNVKFSVRFYLMEQAQQADGTFQRKLAYALNTLDAELLIKPALNPSVDIYPEEVGGLFEKSIINSQHTNDGRIPPLTPHFNTPGTDMTIEDKENCFVRYMTEKESPLKIQVAKLHDNKLILKAQAVAADSGVIIYDWKLARDGEKFDDGSFKWQSLNTPGEVKYEKAVFPVDSVSGKAFLSNLDRYYYNQGDDENPDWQPYVGLDVPEDLELYEEYVCYELPAEGEVVGYYSVGATNTIGDIEAGGLSSSETWSSFCYLPGPADVQFVDGQAYSYVIEDGIPTIKVNTIKDINDPNMTYTWYYSALDREAAISSAQKNMALTNVSKLNNLNELKPGWYTANVAVNLNRKDKDAAPEGEAHTIYANATIESVKAADDIDDTVTLQTGQHASFEVVVTVNPPEGFTEDTIADDLYKNLIYKWEHKASDTKDWVEIKPEDISDTNPTKLVVSMKDNTITVRKSQFDNAAVRRYRCIVTNDLGEKNSVTVIPDESMEKSPIFSVVATA